jgi:uncharacterized protein YndB with AHSA1/START domain
MAQSSSTAIDSRPSLTLKRRFSASPEKVYAAWTDPQKLIRWLRPEIMVPDTAQAEIDLRVGGRYRFSFRANDGEYFEVGGVYREVISNARLAFTWAWHSTPERESYVEISLSPDGSGTLLTLHHAQFADQKARDSHEQGWTIMLDNIANLLA